MSLNITKNKNKLPVTTSTSGDSEPSELDKIIAKYNLGTGSTSKFQKRPVNLNEITQDVKDMLSFFPLSEHNDVVLHTIKGADLGIYGFKVYYNKLYTILVPENPSSPVMPMLCAHTDTVGNVHPNKFSYTDVTESYICNSEHKNLGADDRLGCYLINKMIKSNPNDFIFALFDQEETGGIGSSAFTKSPEFSEICEKVSCFLGLDRRGDSDMASYGSESEEFLEELRKIPDFVEAMGTFTDVATLAEESNISCVNFSVGYYGEHGTSEKFSPTEVLNTLEMLQTKLPKTLWEKQYKFEDTGYGRYGRYGIYGNIYGYHGLLYSGKGVNSKDYEKCDWCGITMHKDKIVTSGVECICKYCYEDYYGDTPIPSGTQSTQENQDPYEVIQCDYCGMSDYRTDMEVTEDGLCLCRYCAEEDYYDLMSSNGVTEVKEIPKVTKGNKDLKVNGFEFLDFIAFIADEAIEYYGNSTVLKQAMRDINLLSYFSKFEVLKDDQAEKVRAISDYYGYKYII